MTAQSYILSKFRHVLGVEKSGKYDGLPIDKAVSVCRLADDQFSPTVWPICQRNGSQVTVTHNYLAHIVDAVIFSSQLN